MLRAAREGTWQRFLTEVLIVMSDGHVDDDCRAADAAGRQAGKSGILVIAACASRQCNERCLAEVAAGPRYFFRHNEHVLMLKAFERIFDRIIKINLRWLRILDDPAPHVIYDQGSGTPEPEDEDEGRLAWEWVYIPTDGVTITHRVIPVATGEIPTSREASGAMQDNFGRTVEFDFEIPIITVHEPTATVTASPTATPTTPPTTPPTPNVTPMLEPVYMPRAVRVE